MKKNASARILIVEDDASLLEVLQYVLEDAGYRVLTADDGAGALKLAARDRVDLVLLDVGLARVSGFEVARALRGNQATSGIAIAFHTGMARDVVSSKFPDYDLFLPKADDVDRLLSSIESLVVARRQAPSAAGLVATPRNTARSRGRGFFGWFRRGTPSTGARPHPWEGQDAPGDRQADCATPA